MKARVVDLLAELGSGRRVAAAALAGAMLLVVMVLGAPQLSIAARSATHGCVHERHWHAPSKQLGRPGHPLRVCAQGGNASPRHKARLLTPHGGHGTAQLGGGYDNARIAQLGLAEVGRNGGSCKEAVNRWVAEASNGTQRLGGGYFSDYQRAGGIRVGRDDTIEGDVIQLNGPRVDSFYEGMHSAVVVAHTPGSNVFDVVDSNWGWTNTVHHHTVDIFALARQHGLSVSFWRMGSAPASLPAPVAAPAPAPQASPAPTPSSGSHPPAPGSPAAQAIRYYDCAGTPNAFGHYVPAGRHWGNDFVARGSTILGGFLQMGANTDGNNHQASIGIFTGGPNTLSGELGSVTVDVNGYGGVSFSFPQPIHVTPGQSLWLVASGIGDFTGYDQNVGGADGCFVGNLVGTP